MYSMARAIHIVNTNFMPVGRLLHISINAVVGKVAAKEVKVLKETSCKRVNFRIHEVSSCRVRVQNQSRIGIYSYFEPVRLVSVHVPDEVYFSHRHIGRQVSPIEGNLCVSWVCRALSRCRPTSKWIYEVIGELNIVTFSLS